MGPFVALPDRRLGFRGNRIHRESADIMAEQFSVAEMQGRVAALAKDPAWGHLAVIHDVIHAACGAFFHKRGTRWIPLPLTTRMISSPGAVYGREAISYTTDTSPIKLKWFGLDRDAFLAESSQIYLELALIQDAVQEGFCIYNSFRKEPADPSHLSEFHHVEFEGHLTQAENVTVAVALLREIVGRLTSEAPDALEHFLEREEVRALDSVLRDPEELSFAEAMASLEKDTGDARYSRLTLGEFGAWEEVRLTELTGGRLTIVREFPLLEVPFYHRPIRRGEVEVADAADMIWPGYREIVGSGARVGSLEQLQRKAAIFQLPEPDYRPYVQSRTFPEYRPTAGFGLGWERLVQGMLRLPHIWDTVPFPRGHLTLAP